MNDFMQRMRRQTGPDPRLRVMFIGEGVGWLGEVPSPFGQFCLDHNTVVCGNELKVADLFQKHNPDLIVLNCDPREEIWSREYARHQLKGFPGLIIAVQHLPEDPELQDCQFDKIIHPDANGLEEVSNILAQVGQIRDAWGDPWAKIAGRMDTTGLNKLDAIIDLARNDPVPA